MLPENTVTIAEFIDSGASVTMSYNVLSFIDILSNGTEATILNVLNDYMQELRQISFKVRLNNKEYYKYAYKPKLLSFDLYGTTELYFIILLLNDMADVKEFTKNPIYLPKPSLLSDFLTNVYNAERVDISEYNSKRNTTTSS